MRNDCLLTRLTALLMTIVLGIGTLLQFHHHDDDGHVFLTLLPGIEVTLGGKLHKGEVEPCHHDHDSDHGRELCSMHFDPTVEPDNSDNDLHLDKATLQLLLVFFCYDPTYVETAECQDSQFRLSPRHPSPSPLRAPPSIS